MDDITKKLVLIFTLASLTLHVHCAPRPSHQHDQRMTSHQPDDVIQTYRTNKPRQDNKPLGQPMTERQTDASLPTHCQPVSNEVLWQKLDTHGASSTYRHRFSSTGDELFTGSGAATAPGEGPAESSSDEAIRSNSQAATGGGAFTVRGQKRIRRSLQVSQTESTAAARGAKISPSSSFLVPAAAAQIPGASKQSKQSTHYFTRVHSTNSSHSQRDMTEWPFVNDGGDDVDVDVDDDDATPPSVRNKGVNSSISNANNSLLLLHRIIKSRQIRSSKPFSTGGVAHSRRGSNSSSDTRSPSGRIEKLKPSAAANRNKTQINVGGKNSKIQLKTGETGVKRYETWQCQLETHWKRMPEDLFPPFVETGRCVQKTCMMGMYACVPKYYVIKVLRRIEPECNPLNGQQNMTSSASPEDAWVLFDYSVIVGCDCSKRRKTGKFSISRTSDDEEDIVTVV